MNTKIIKGRIAELGLTNIEVAETLDINPQTLSNWINNKNIERIEKFIDLLILLNLEINDIKKEG